MLKLVKLTRRIKDNSCLRIVRLNGKVASYLTFLSCLPFDPKSAHFLPSTLTCDYCCRRYYVTCSGYLARIFQILDLLRYPGDRLLYYSLVSRLRV